MLYTNMRKIHICLVSLPLRRHELSLRSRS